MKLIRLIFFVTLWTLSISSAKSYAQQTSERYTYEDIEAAMISADFETMQNQVKVINNILSTNSNPRDRLALNEALGMLYLHLGNYDEGHEAFRKCWDIVQHSYPLEFSLYHRILFGMIITSEDNGVRMDVLDKAADYTDIQDGSYYHHINIAISSAFIQDYDFAIEEFNTALDLQNDDNVSDKRWGILTFILTLKQVNNMYVEKGEYDTALRIQESFQRNIQESFGTGSYYDIVFELEKASTFLKLGNIDKAQASLNLVRRLASDNLIHFADFYALQGDIAYAKNDFLSANVQYNTAASIFKSLNRNYTSIMIKQMTCLSKLGFDEEAEKMSDIIDAALDSHYDNTLTAEYLLQYSNILIDSKINGLAVEILQTGLLNIEDLGDYDSLLKVKNALGAAYIKAGDYENAVALYRDIIRDEKQRAHDIFAFLPEGQRELYWKMKEPLMNNIFRLNQEGTVTAARGTVFEVSKGKSDLTSSILYDASLLNKGLLLEAFLNMQRTIMASGDQELISAFEELRRLKGSDPERAEELEKTLIEKTNSYGDYMDFTRISWQDVRDNLEENEAAIEFVVSETDEVSYYSAEILRKDYDQPQHVFLFAQKNEDTTLKKMSVYDNDRLYKKTWGKIAGYLEGCSDVYFAPVGEFYRIGMEYLPVNDSVRINDVYDMHRLSSTKSLAGRKKDNHAMKIASAALYGGLDYNLDSENMEYYAYAMQTGLRGSSSVNLSNTRNIQDMSWGYLRGTAEEVTGISGILEDMKCRTALYTGGEGVEESFKMLDDKSPQVIHVATHGFFFEPSSDISISTGLVFAGANNYGKSGNAIEGIDDGLLTSKEIAEMNLTGAELVVLSACQTGVGEISGEGVFGLQRGFKKACAETLLMSLWEVDDNATNELMTRFYSGLASGLDKHEALHEAQNHVMQTCGPDPSLWAGFILLD